MKTEFQTSYPVQLSNTKVISEKLGSTLDNPVNQGSFYDIANEQLAHEDNQRHFWNPGVGSYSYPINGAKISPQIDIFSSSHQ
jgi:hypothetical protein